MSRLAIFCAGFLMIAALSGCCHSGGYPCGGGYGAGYGAGYGGGCATGACGAAAPGYPSAGLYGPATPMTAYGAPVPGYQQAAAAPVDTLSTF